MKYCLTIDAEEWFNILDIPEEIPLEKWGEQENRLCRNFERLFSLLQQYKIKATFFWLAYFAEKYPELVKQCADAGHEVASHGYAHVLAFKVGRGKFREDIRKGKAVLEDIIQQPVLGFRAAGFSTKNDTTWTFEEIRAAGYLYDSSVFPASRGHGGMSSSPLGPHKIQTEAGELLEIPQSMIEIFGKRISLFGGGYLRLTPALIIRWGIRQLEKKEQPLIVYVHPREIDPEHPHLKMSLFRTFKSYVNLRSTYPKLEKLCQNYSFSQMRDFLEDF